MIKYIVLFILISVTFSQTKLIKSKILDEDRFIQIHLPSDYHTAKHKYPVVYLLDSEYVFNYAVGATEFLSNSFGYLPKMILVGIPNTDRSRDLFVNFQENGSYKKFIQFLTTELHQYISKNFRTNNFNILYGWSSGAGIVNQVMIKHTNLFHGYIESGSGIGSKTTNFISNNITNINFGNKKLYVNVEGNGRRVKGFNNYKTLLNSLDLNGLEYKFEKLDGVSHVNTLSKGFFEGLKYIFSEYYIPDEITLKGFTSFKSYYENLNYPYDIQIPIGAFIESATILYKQETEAIKILEYGIKLNSNSSELYGALAEIYFYAGNTLKSKELYKKASQLANANKINQNKYKILAK